MLSTQKSKTVICPGCGKIETINTTIYDIGFLEGRIKDQTIEDRRTKQQIDGIKWCLDCK